VQGELIEAATLARFRAGCEALTGITPAAERPLGVAVSGGGDSLALLLLAQAAYPGCVRAATVDHSLRAEAAAEAANVAAICASMGVPHATLCAGPAQRGVAGNLQQRARLARYRLLGAWAAEQDIGWIALAHQRDDVAESFLMRAARGAGVKGLAAMQAVRPNEAPGFRTVIVRPVLNWARAELAAIVAAAGLTPVEDPTNADARFDRARMRALLAGHSDLPADRLARAATNLRDAEDALDWVVAREAPARLEVAGSELWLRVEGLPFELKRRLVVLAIGKVRARHALPDQWRDTAVPDLVHALEQDRAGTLADVQARVLGDRWQFRLAPPRRTSGATGAQ
jgi:tRNA(Ile)-lysidine synthase